MLFLKLNHNLVVSILNNHSEDFHSSHHLVLFLNNRLVAFPAPVTIQEEAIHNTVVFLNKVIPQWVADN